MAAPIFVQEAETAWNTTTSPKTTATFNVLTGDVLVAYSIVEGFIDVESVAISNNSTALTWTQRQFIQIVGNCYVSIWTAPVPADRTGLTVTFTRTGVGNFGGNVLTFRGSNGIGTSAKDNQAGAPTLGLASTGSNSVAVVVSADWNAGDGSTRTWRTVNGNTPTSGNGFERTYDGSGVGGSYTPYGAYYPDLGTSGSSVTVGLSAPTGQQYSIIAVEVLGGSSDATVTTPVVDGLGDVVNPAVSAGSSIVSPIADGTGGAPVPMVTGTGDASMLAGSAGGTGDVATPLVSADASISATPADAAGALPPLSALISMVIGSGPLIASGAVVTPTISGSSDATVTEPPADVVGDIEEPSISAGSNVTSPTANAVGSLPAPAAGGGSNATVLATSAAGAGKMLSMVVSDGRIVPRIDLPTTIVIHDPKPEVLLSDPDLFVEVDLHVLEVLIDG